jgi:hypothetical protein
LRSTVYCSLPIWRYDGKRVTIFKMIGGEYVEGELSAAFPEVHNADLSHFSNKPEP